MAVMQSVCFRRHWLWGGCHPVVLEPVSGLACTEVKDDDAVWRAKDSDPQFQFSSQGGLFPLPGGWYRLRMQIHVQSGILRKPCLYPMYDHSGYSETTAISLRLRNGWIDQIIMLPNPVLQLRFDPSINLVEFVIRSVEFCHLTRMGALWHLFARNQCDEISGWSVLARMVGRFAATSLRHGISRGADDLYQQYKAAYAQEKPELDYSRWVALYDADAVLKTVKVMDSDPLISILLPVYNMPLHWLRRCIGSVLAQAFPQWELCIVDDASTESAVWDVLASYAERDSRIKIKFRKKNGHISVASQNALDMASGEFVVLLDHDDELRPHSLLEVVNALRQRPYLDFIYSDEDKIDGEGCRFDPYFKPDWNPDLLQSQNYICHMAVIRKSVVLRAGGFRSGYEGSQDHDLFLRCTAKIDPARILHLPKILYHWRAIEGSTALENTVKTYAGDAGGRAITDHLASVCSKAGVMRLPCGYYRVKWPIPEPVPKVSLIVPTRDRVDLLKVCIESIRQKTEYPHYEILIVDNQSNLSETLAYFDRLQQLPNVRVLPFDAPFNYSAINNHAVSMTDADVVGLINSDVEVINPDWLNELVSHALRPGIGAVGAMLYYPNNTIQHAGTVLGIGGVAGHIYHNFPRGSTGMAGRALVVQNLSAVTAACLVIKRERYLECGGLDEINLPVAFNDVDFCLRLLEAGYRNVWTPFAELYHHESASRGLEDTPEKQARFMAETNYMRYRWGHILDDDPAYNPNLTLASQDSALAFPPRTRNCS